MSLRWYRRPRLVVLNPESSVLEAARALEQNRIGAVVVQDKGRVVGIVTDRDLAVRALGRALDPATTPISAVMTPAPATLDSAASIKDAIALMQERNVRRIPLLESTRVIGMVTLDDLLLDEAASLEALAAIVHSQLGRGGPSTLPRTRSRSLARAEATLTRMLAEVRAETKLEDFERARHALDAVLHALVRRLTPNEAGDLIAQLPSLLQPHLRALPPGPDKSITRASIEADLGTRLGVDAPQASWILTSIAGIVANSISSGQVEDVRGQLPADLRDLFRHDERFPLFI